MSSAPGLTSRSDPDRPREQSRGAWQPLTPRGVAAFASASAGRLMVAQILTALLVAAAFVWFLYYAWLPVVHQAVTQLPEEGRIQGKVLLTPLTTPTILAQEPLLGFMVDLPQQTGPTLNSDVRAQFHREDVEVCTRFGCMVFRYPANWIIGFNRPEVAPSLQAWAPFVLAAIGFVAILLLLSLWTFLTALLFFVPLLVCRYSDKALTWSGSWKLTAATWMPASLILMLALVLYAREWTTLPQTCLLLLAHVLVAWFYLILSPLALPSTEEMEKEDNPFAPPPPPSSPGPSTDLPTQKNPFASPTPGLASDVPEDLKL